MALKNLPIGVQTFKKMREGNYVYVDKTEYIYQIASTEGVYFLSRPRRFGKSLFVSTLKELFEGNQLLFNDLWIADKWDWSQKTSVIHLSFAKLDYQNLGLAAAITEELIAIAQKKGIRLTKKSYKGQFEELIEQLHAKYGKVVVLIDEYDKPIIDYLEQVGLKQAKTNQKTLKAFYSVLKDAESYLRLLFITGVSKFSKVSIFSDLNHLNDITLDAQFAQIAGYSQAELEFYFEDYIQVLMKFHNLNRETLLALMKHWYNGFSWDGIHTLYNPFCTLNFLSQKDFRNYWFTSATPTFLFYIMKRHTKFTFENALSSGALLDKYDLDNLDLIPLLFQTGYLTIKKRDFMTGEMVLGYPNREVRDSMYAYLINSLAPNYEAKPAELTVHDLSAAFQQNDLTRVEEIVNTLFSDVPYNLFEKQVRKDGKAMDKFIDAALLAENFFHGLIHLVFKYLGVFIESEVHTARGRADSVVQTKTHIYLFEFKFNKTADEAFQQIIDRDYARKYQLSGKIIIGIGVNFNRKSRLTDTWIIKNL
jgi:Predicted AAA-ATPase/PD-(D/E)XK nuclease superfamily